MKTGPALKLVTWNIHRGRGRDGIIDPDRIAQMIETDIAPEAPDILALQEADTECPPHAGFLDLSRIEATTGLRYAHSDERLRWGPESHGFLGAIVFLNPAWQVVAADVIDLPGHCHRGAIVLDAARDEAVFRVMATHLSLTQILRIAQMRTVAQFLRRRGQQPTILMGDLNEWRPWGGAAFSKAVMEQRFAGPALATFPSGRPILPLDRILGGPGIHVSHPRVLNTPAIRAASDHLPLVATVTLPGRLPGSG
ncbi:endonuclease/exonuclease/phosphatase family protein [Actibacterium sp. 188UL27-1]|uniref:endonuclease/exonuclease/phosphatase family protein n=1 Tax=Actibacterium sp. 188UL27-1 TaxID=2786961 RepID=UPI00195C6A13|nr:endonuclease/exonuclease/phosphatase family protein [Actibacterium sp. 188UL27-1]MBM7069263.1 endonuclease/exonuclease/phosphatase family protein [Actibacterium sp. 188UL27-1]